MNHLSDWGVYNWNADDRCWSYGSQPSGERFPQVSSLKIQRLHCPAKTKLKSKGLNWYVMRPDSEVRKTNDHEIGDKLFYEM